MHFEENLRVSLEGLLFHKLRSILTMLGIIFGVAAVIAMISIGEGAKREAIEKFKVLGVHNIIVREKDLSDKELKEIRAKFSQGLSQADADAIRKILPTTEHVVPQTEIEIEARFEDKTAKCTVVGVTPIYTSILNYQTQIGIFLNEDHSKRNLRVCVLGADVAKSLFPVQDPLHKMVKLQDDWFEVIGVMESKTLFTETVGELASRNLNQDVFVPLPTLLQRFTRKNKLSSEISQITVKVKETDELIQSAGIIRRIINRRHYGNDDFSLVIPYELLKQEEKERRIYNILLGSIAAISLLVGGIGIMNIMLATVLERTHEIGIRRALGATRREILEQFVMEALSLSLIGGLLGILLGVGMSLAIDVIAEFKTVVSLISIVIAFTISAAIGVIFGTFPAKKAAEVHPIEALRYE